MKLKFKNRKKYFVIYNNDDIKLFNMKVKFVV